MDGVFYGSWELGFFLGDFFFLYSLRSLEEREGVGEDYSGSGSNKN